MINKGEFKKIMSEKGYTVRSLSKEIKIDESTFFRKLQKGDSFTLGETLKIYDLLNLTKEQAINIFFSKNVA